MLLNDDEVSTLVELAVLSEATLDAFVASWASTPAVRRRRIRRYMPKSSLVKLEVAPGLAMVCGGCQAK